METTVVAVIVAVIGSGLIQYFITRYDDNKGINKRLINLEKDTLRTQLLLLILLKPDETHEILTIAEHYFKQLKGNWYMTSIFNKWLEDTGTAKPDWFTGDKE